MSQLTGTEKIKDSWQVINGKLERDGSLPLTADWDVGGHKITNLSDPSSASDAATKGYVDNGLNTKVSKSGDTVTGMMAFRMGIDVEATNVPPDKIGVIYANGATGSLNYRDLTGNQVIWHTGNNPSIVSPNGYQKLASGIILQWGTATITTEGDVTLPIAFPTANLHVFGQVETATATNNVGIGSFIKTGFHVWVNGSGAQTIHWFAIGI